MTEPAIEGHEGKRKKKKGSSKGTALPATVAKALRWIITTRG
jgi:hypothetical protein